MHGKNTWSMLLKKRREEQLTMTEDMRRIAILPTLLQLYCADLRRFAQRSVDDVSQSQPAFRPRRQCHDAVVVLRSFIERKTTSNWRQPVLIAYGGLPESYDNLRNSLAWRRLLDTGPPEIIVAAAIRETRTCRCGIKMCNIVTKTMPRFKSLCQGKPPLLFTHIIDVAISCF